MSNARNKTKIQWCILCEDAPVTDTGLLCVMCRREADKPMPKKTKTKTQQTPKRIHIRTIANGRLISVGEYVNARYRTIIAPFNSEPNTDQYKRSIATLQQCIDSFQKRNNNRHVVAVIPHEDFTAKHIADVLTIPLE